MIPIRLERSFFAGTAITDTKCNFRRFEEADRMRFRIMISSLPGVLRSLLMSMKMGLRTMQSTKVLMPLCDISSVESISSKGKIIGPTSTDVTSVLKVWSTGQRFGKNGEGLPHLGPRGFVNESDGFPLLSGHLRHARHLLLSMKYCSYTLYLSSGGSSAKRWNAGLSSRSSM